MKRRVLSGICVLLLVALSFILAWQYERQHAVYAYNPDNLIRLHVVANSDSEADQVLKRKVRDAIIRGMTPEVAGVNAIADARSIVRADLDVIGKLAAEEIRKQGFDYPVRVCYGQFPFPTKKYGALTLPADEYEAVKVILGEGKGANWWCVLFPPLCFVKVEDKSKSESIIKSGALPVTSSASAALVDLPPPAAGKAELPNAEPQIEFRFKIIDFVQALGKKFSGKVEGSAQ